MNSSRPALAKSSKDFSFDRVEDFEGHIKHSIPRYEDCIANALGLADYFVQADTNVYDIGCSTGRFLRSLKAPDGVRKIGMDRSLNLLPANDAASSFLAVDLNEDFVFNNASLVVSMFTLQFLALSRRQRVLERIYQGLNKGGALIICEKTYSSDAKIQDVMTFLYYDFKSSTFTPEEIFDKEKALRRQMWPLSHDENVAMLRQAGFTKLDTFFKQFNFEGIVCVK